MCNCLKIIESTPLPSGRIPDDIKEVAASRPLYFARMMIKIFKERVSAALTADKHELFVKQDGSVLWFADPDKPRANPSDLVRLALKNRKLTEELARLRIKKAL